MNRRDFTRSLVAVSATPFLPMPAMAKPVAAIAPRSIDLMWGGAIARAQNSGNVQMLAQSLKVTPDVAQAVQAHLLKTRVITMGATPGATVAVKPTFPVQTIVEKAAQAMEKVEQVLDAIPQDDDPIPAPDPAPEPTIDVPAK